MSRNTTTQYDVGLSGGAFAAMFAATAAIILIDKSIFKSEFTIPFISVTFILLIIYTVKRMDLKEEIIP